MPFGQTIDVPSTSPRSGAGCYTASDSGMRQKFTGKERDSETGLDFFGARYFSGAQGRFTSPDPLVLTGTRLVDPQGLNLYSYVRNRPLIAIDDGGFATVVVAVGSRQSATVTYHSGIGMKSYYGLARGQGRNRRANNGDTPFGKYKVTGYNKGRLGPAYGRAKIRMEPVRGQNEALTSNPPRTNLRIHGGGSNARLVPDPYADHQPLIGTHGCVRLTNADVEGLWSDLSEDDGDDDDYVYVGDETELKIMSVTNPDLRRAVSRQMWFQSILSTVFLEASPVPKKPKEDPEADRKPPHERSLIPR